MDGIEKTEFRLSALPKELIRHSWAVVAGAMLAVSLVVFSDYFAKPDYLAKGRLLVEARKLETYQLRQAPEGASNPLVGAAMASQIELFRSEQTLREIAHQLEIDGYEVSDFHITSDVRARFRAAIDRWWPLRSEGAPETLTREADSSLADVLKRSLHVNPIGDSQLLEVAFGSESGPLAADVVNRSMETFVGLQREANRQTDQGVLTWLNSEISQLTKSLAALDAQLAQLTHQNDHLQHPVGPVHANALGSQRTSIDVLREERAAQLRILNQFQSRYESYVKGLDAALSPDDVRIVMRADRPIEPSKALTVSTILVAGSAGMALSLLIVFIHILATGTARRVVAKPVLPAETLVDLSGEATVEITKDIASVPAAFGLFEDSAGVSDLADAMKVPLARLAVFAGVGGGRSVEAIALASARRLAADGVRPIVLHVSSLLEGCRTSPGLTELLDGGVAFGDVITRDGASRVHTISAGNDALSPPMRRLTLVIGALSHTYDTVILTFADMTDWCLHEIKPDFAALVGSDELSKADSRGAYEEAFENGAKSVLVVRHTNQGGYESVAQIKLGEAA